MTKREGYVEKLKDPRWQKKRLEVFERDEWGCQSCMDSESTLHVHHRYYLPNTEPWDYPLDALLTLCENCHERERQERPEYEKMLLSALKQKFLADDLYRLTNGILKLKVLYASEVTASIIEWALGTPEIFEGLSKSFWEDIKKNNKERS